MGMKHQVVIAGSNLTPVLPFFFFNPDTRSLIYFIIALKTVVLVGINYFPVL